MFRRDSSGHVSVESFSRRVNLEHSLFGRFGPGFHRVAPRARSLGQPDEFCVVMKQIGLSKLLYKTLTAELNQLNWDRIVK